MSGSTLVTETINGSYDFKIKGYSLHKGIGVGEYLSSEKFTVGGYSWRIRLYPDGCIKQEESADASVSIFLNLFDATNVKAKYEFAILDQSGDEKSIWQDGFRIFQSQGWGWDQFLKHTELEADYLYDDCLHIRCRIGVFKSRTEVREIYSIQVPPSDIAQCFGRLLESGEGSDVNFEVDGHVFVAHKLVLATRSPVFKAQFFGSMMDRNAHSIRIEDMKAHIFKVMLHFIYWDDLPKEFIEINSNKETTLILQDLLVAADRYSLERLLMICSAKLCDGIAIDNAATTLALAEQRNCLPLKSACLRFIALPENIQAVRKTDAFKDLRGSYSNVYTELLEHVAGWKQ